jgi:phosphoribosylanthranilate isomerase
MFTPRIKFCGITRPEDAEHAVSLNSWAVGMILWPRSPRYCAPAAAAAIAAAVHRKVELAGVFVNPTLDEVTEAADQFSLSLLQLHGDEGPVFCGEVARRTGCRVIKAMRVHSGADIQSLRPFHTDFHLMDSYVPDVPGGTGETFEWELARGHRGRTPTILSGGLRPSNVAAGISVVRPYAVDVASGVELSPGVKDHALMDSFAAAVAASAAEPVS